jgi:hypothetical protein
MHFPREWRPKNREPQSQWLWENIPTPKLPDAVSLTEKGPIKSRAAVRATKEFEMAKQERRQITQLMQLQEY